MRVTKAVKLRPFGRTVLVACKTLDSVVPRLDDAEFERWADEPLPHEKLAERRARDVDDSCAVRK